MFLDKILRKKDGCDENYVKLVKNFGVGVMINSKFKRKNRFN